MYIQADIMVYVYVDESDENKIKMNILESEMLYKILKMIKDHVCVCFGDDDNMKTYLSNL